MIGTQDYRILYPSAARTATPTAVMQDDVDHPRLGGHFVIHISAITADPSVVPTIDAYDTHSEQWYNILTGAAITGTGLVVLKVYPGVTATENLAVSDFLPRKWRLVMTHADTDSITYSVSAFLRS